MKRVVYLAPISYVAGKLPMGTENSANGMGIAGRWNTKNAKGLSYATCYPIGKRDISVKPYSVAEVTAQTTLGTISKMVAQRKQSATQRVTDKQNFAAQSTYKTLQQYLYHLCAVQLAEQND